MEELQAIVENQILEIKSRGEVFHREIDRGFVDLFLKNLKLPSTMAESIINLLSIKKRTSIIWLSLSECTGCTESFLRNEIPGFDSLIFEVISLDYHEVLNASAGFNARQGIQDALKGEYILIVEGSVCVQEDYFATFGAEGMSGRAELKHLADHALMVFAVGTCSSFGGVQAAAPNPTKTEGIRDFIGRELVNIPGCPPSDINIVLNLLYAIIFRKAPQLDELMRPVWAYGKTVHDSCERKAKFESGDFVQSFDDEKMQEGYCLYKVGCKGPYAYNNCPKVKFNSKTSWPIQAGHGCIACSEPNFWDDFGVYEEPMKKQYTYFARQKTLREPIETTQNIQDLYAFDKDNVVGVFLDTQKSEIIYQGKNILQTSIDTNPKNLLQNLAKKSKLTGRLVENYQNYFKSIYDRNMQFSDEITLSDNLVDVLGLTHFLVSADDEKEPAMRLVKEALSFTFPQISDMDFSVKIQDEKIVIDASKGMRLPLCYILGGLDYDGIAYGMLATLCKSIREGIGKFFVDTKIEQVVLGGNLTQNALVQEWLIKS
ncbi:MULTISPECIES: hydrogenase small subunit [unclassified Helicobacter]|uniref:hydrogenase small subunit n=1 Tax=unclassified Helicobacter TaxID=2593540 RepID=UPI000CF14837|nr:MULTISPECIES: hydrogenase small subunit [unclassified Helicobacter]